jgi:hypothetical protein
MGNAMQGKKPAGKSKPPFEPPIRVVQREQIFGGEIAQIAMPANGRREVVRMNGVQRVSWRLMCHVIGGHVGLYVLQDSAIDPRGRTMVGHVSLWKERFSDGRTFPALHFRPSAKPATHRLVMVADDTVPQKYGMSRVYRADPLVGFIIYQPLPRPM